jgi:hypothetical protein
LRTGEGFTEGREGNEGAVGRAPRGGRNWRFVLAAGFFDANGDFARRDFNLAEAGDVTRWGNTKRRTGERVAGAKAGLIFFIFIGFYLKNQVQKFLPSSASLFS